ncbi:DUF2785 domain-containing protein [Bacillus pseudomycoides]|uniref:DUF2785 domain-containing protein n=2 Tax=Bacillus pseudomycoides TaxID=64104 RepID=UPI0014837B00|nr:DUF2785 domain-containing protein [Bacillus pseudomycoides]
MDFKTQLKTLNNNIDQTLDIELLDELIDKMIANIGIIDPELRDELIYSIFEKWIRNDYLTKSQLQYLMKTCLSDNYLFYKIGEKNTDSVFTRSFSALVITEILSKDGEFCFLDKYLVLEGIEKSLKYLQKENDTRGYVDGKGWAHGIAHGADLLTAAIKHPKFSLEYVNECLCTIKLCLFKDAQYIDNEDGRMIFILEALHDNKNIGECTFKNWIISLLTELKDMYKSEGHSLFFFRRRTNIINFLKTLYFRIPSTVQVNKSKQIIEDEIKMWHKMIYEN